jgi:radical SAM enzyme (TIGR01210 family)
LSFRETTSALPISDSWILAQRGPKLPLDPWKPHAFLVEPERTSAGKVEDVATIFLTNRECPFRCLMCDLWKYTTDERVPAGAIPAQIAWALERLPAAPHLKLYNAGNFFDAQAIPPGDLPAVARLVAHFRTVIVECHPLLVGPRCLAFREMMTGSFQIAMGLETVHPEILPQLNKRMTLPDFSRAVRFLRDNGLTARAFILLRPPFLTEAEGVEWAKRSLRWAFDQGVECCSVIPTRAGNGAMEHLQAQGLFEPPSLASLEEVVAHGIELQAGRAFADLWDIEQLFTCPHCGPARASRLRTMNLTQTVPPPVECTCARTR